jgi:aminoglycoside phosphotransferase family enzyme
MPLIKSKSKKAVSKNISEFHKGKTFAKTAKKFGKDKANKQAVAVALNTAKKTGAQKKKKKYNGGGFEAARKKHFGIK